MAGSSYRGICDLLERAVDNQLKKYEIKFHGERKANKLFRGQIIYVSLKHKATGEEKHMVIKKFPHSNNKSTIHTMTSYFFNEIHFYTKILPAIEDFQLLFSNRKWFDKFPRCLAICSDTGFEKLAFENLENYRTYPKSEPLDSELFDKIFKMYGEFHGLFYAFKYLHPEDFAKLTEPLRNYSEPLIGNKILRTLLQNYFRNVQHFFEEIGDIDTVIELQKYVVDGMEIYMNCLDNKGANPIFLHGDCWSDNWMLKYNAAEEIEDIKMLDFQQCVIGSPVTDLSYCFYSGARKECLDNLDQFLIIYHNALSATLEQYGCDPNKIYPHSTLKEEWRENGRFGFIMGVVMWRSKTAYNFTEMPNLMEIIDNFSELSLSVPYNFGVSIDEEKYREITIGLVKHMHERGYL